MNNREKIASVILAAGCSSRMSAFKPLLPFGNITVVERIIQIVQDSGVETIIVVSGHMNSCLEPIFDRLGVTSVINENYMTGMYSSVQAGVGKLEKDVDSFFIFPCDMPAILSSTLLKLMEVRNQTDSGIIYPCYNKRRGHPPLISNSYASTILSSNPKDGLRELLRSFSADSVEVEVNDPGILMDIDTPEDYSKIRKVMQ